MKNRMNVGLPRVLGAGMVLVFVGLIGCESAPRGDTGGRIDPYRTTAADRHSHRASMPSMLEYSDQVAMALAHDLAGIPEISQSSKQLILELGDINNQTHTPTVDFEILQKRIRAGLHKSPEIRRQFLIVEGRGRMNRELNRVNDFEGEKGGTAVYDAADTYVLQGDFLESVRGNVSRYYFEFKLTNLKSRQIVFLEDYDLGQRHGH